MRVQEVRSVRAAPLQPHSSSSHSATDPVAAAMGRKHKLWQQRRRQQEQAAAAATGTKDESSDDDSNTHGRDIAIYIILCTTLILPNMLERKIECSNLHNE